MPKNQEPSDLTPADVAAIQSLPPGSFAGLPDVSKGVPLNQLKIGSGTNGQPIGPFMGLVTGKDNSGGGGQGGPNYDSQAQGIIKGLTEGNVTNPGNALIWQLGDLLSKVSPSQAQTLLKEIPSGSTLAEGLNLALSPNAGKAAQAAATGSSGGDALSQALGNLFTNTLAPWLQQQQSAGDANFKASMSGAEDAIKGSPMAKYLDPAFKTMEAAQQQMDTATMQSAATAPQYAGLVNALTQMANNYKTAQSVMGAAPYIAQMYQTGQIPGNLPGMGANGLLAPPTLQPTNP